MTHCSGIRLAIYLLTEVRLHGKALGYAFAFLNCGKLNEGVVPPAFAHARAGSRDR
jgi:hypothetical protein